MKRIVIIADTHCGHRAGLTPPAYQYREDRDAKYAAIQSHMWAAYTSTLDALQPIDILVHNGDAVEGKGDKTGGSELIDADREVQVDMAVQCIREAKAPRNILVYGTAYHTGKEEDWESVIASELDAEIHSHPFIDVNGTIFDFKHKISSSVIPHGRYTAPQRDKLWNILWAERELQPKAKIIVRSHVHYYTFSGDSRNLVITTPCLQGPGSKFGARLCSGTIDIGLLVFDCEEDGTYDYTPHIFEPQFMAEQAIAV